ncbi:unnamed protein product [Ambrosiozyma monospora]|uniref:Unnamed protein product n=1 Tax=Ambrosiozyma monospora TaxID=43982 RepID=A0ACB5T2V0_AMBMO|nr:unnamed protein product [Ambrosiozyma monospora]
MAIDEELGSLIAQSTELISNSQPEDAVTLLKQQFSKYETNPLYLQSLGESLLESGDMENAYDTLQQGCKLDPLALQGVEKFLYLGQIIGGSDGIQLLSVGVARLSKQLKQADANFNGIELPGSIVEAVQSFASANNKSTEQDEENDETLQLLAKAYPTLETIRVYLLKRINETIFAMIEIWMTDLCMEPRAESECESLIQLSLQLDPTNGETWSLLASIRISQQRFKDAQDAVCKSWEFLSSKKSKLEDASAGQLNNNGTTTGDAEIDEETITEIQADYVDLDQPLTTLAKYSIELGQFELAITISSSIQDINENSIESYYLEGFANYLNAIRIQEGLSLDNLEGCLELARDFENHHLKKSSATTEDDESVGYVNDARVALSNGYKLLQVDEVAEQTDDGVKSAIESLLNQVGGFLLKEKDVSGLDESNWETEIAMDD